MLNFTNPAFLWLLPFALAPAVLHFFYKRKTKIILFSTLVFFREKEKFFAYRRKLMEIFLLFLRILTILFVVLALSRPFFRKYSFAGNAGTDGIILLDDTMSMQRSLPGGSSAFELAKRQAEALMNSFSGGDGAGLEFLSGKPGIGLTRERGRVLESIRSAEITGSAGNFRNALTRAVEQLKNAPGTNREIHLISDFQKSAMPGKKFPGFPLRNVRIFLIAADGTKTNMRISADELDSAPKIAGRPVSFPFTVTNYSDTARDARISFEIGGSILQTKNLRMNPRSKVQDFFSYTPERGGRLSGRIVLEDSDTPLDNEAFFTLRIANTLHVLMLSPDTESDPFRYPASALDPRPGEASHGIGVRKLSFAGMKKTGDGGAKILAVSPGSASDPELTKMLAQKVRSGSVLLAFPERAGSDRFYRDLATEMNIGSLYRKGLRPIQAKGVKFFGNLANLNELLNLDLVRFRKLAEPEPSVGKCTAKTNSGEDIIREIPFGLGRVFVFAFPPGRTGSNWPELKSFPVSWICFANAAAGYAENAVRPECGEEVRIPGEKVTAITPDGKMEKLSGIWKGSFTPGIALFSGSPVIEAAVVSIPEKESDPECLSKKEIPRAFENSVTLLDPEADPAQQVAAFRKGSELSGILLLLAIVFCTFEFLLGLRLIPFPKKKTDGHGGKENSKI